jgi:hypothetical protein
LKDRHRRRGECSTTLVEDVADSACLLEKGKSRNLILVPQVNPSSSDCTD